MAEFTIGQRWISETEPELGLGTILKTDPQMVILEFPASGSTRQYARESAPLKRVRFRIGDQVTTREKKVFKVESVEEEDGLLVYRGEGQQLPESRLSDSISFSRPEDRLLRGQVDGNELFNLRYETIEHQHEARKSPVRGFLGGRIELIPHQLYVAQEVSSRQNPRVLLADEVGLGKTIEACLILHRLLLSRRVERVLILAPESLVHQWFVELLRRFNLWFHIFDEERCEAISAHDPEANPFLDDQLVLCSISFLADNPLRQKEALEAGWDMLVVDEAHHLGWSPDGASPEYTLVEALGNRIPSLLLLTATPEQLGMSSHFARLRLLDPARYYDLGQFLEETKEYQKVARIAGKLLNNKKLTGLDARALSAIFGSPGIKERIEAIAGGDERARMELLDDLLDQHGTGRVMFRNTRAAISGFPKRLAHLIPLPPPPGCPEMLDQISGEFTSDTSREPEERRQECDFSREPRVEWLAAFLKRLEGQKALLICRTVEKVTAIEAALRQRINVKTALFHELMPLIQRDRNAAWFAEEGGAQILLCSEIGGEGRNFQFAHHLVLFDLPLDPELLEQRIGRLDRIGQTADVHVHLPYVAGSSQEVLARWHHEGLNAIEKNFHGGNEMLQLFGKQVLDLALDFHETGLEGQAALDQLLIETKKARKQLAERLERGRDRLLELNSFRPVVAAKVAAQIAGTDASSALEEFLLRIFDQFGVHTEELAARTWQLGSAGVFADSFPALPPDGLTVTFDRKKALSREEMGFLSWDHPMVTGAKDLMLGSEKGNSAFAIWPDGLSRDILLEAVYLLECVAPGRLHVDRFFPATPIRVIVDHQLADCSGRFSIELLEKNLKDSSVYSFLDRPEISQVLLPKMLHRTQELAEARIPGLVVGAVAEMETHLGHEVARLRALRQVNRSIREEEIALAEEQITLLRQHMETARLRLDALRLIWKGPREFDRGEE
jgi:ATP-dependent helicase HepA